MEIIVSLQQMIKVQNADKRYSRMRYRSMQTLFYEIKRTVMNNINEMPFKISPNARLKTAPSRFANTLARVSAEIQCTRYRNNCSRVTCVRLHLI